MSSSNSLALTPLQSLRYSCRLALGKGREFAVTGGPCFPQTLLRRLATEDDDAAAAPQTLLKCFGQSPEDYCVKVLKKVGLPLFSLVIDGIFFPL